MEDERGLGSGFAQERWPRRLVCGGLLGEDKSPCPFQGKDRVTSNEPLNISEPHLTQAHNEGIKANGFQDSNKF